MKARVTVFLGSVTLLAITQVSAQVLYQEDFDVDATANWTVNASSADDTADFFFDYSTVGIPSAPNSGGTTLGLKLQANTTDGVFGGISVSPTGLNLTGDYILRFDLWMNTVGPFPGGGSGSTQLSGGGVGTAGTSPQWPGNADSVYFNATGDGGSSADYRVYSPAAPASYPDGDPVYVAPSRNAADPLYSTNFPGQAPPLAQAALFPNQVGAVQDGAQAFAWRDVAITKSGDVVSWTVDGVNLANVDLVANGITLGGGNILFMQSDINNSSSTDPNAGALLFGLVDNVEVSVIPEPTTFTLLGLGSLALVMVKRRR